METLFADLHVHTIYSDGTFSPEESVEYAQKVGLSAISITDHDTTEGIPRAIKSGLERGIEVIPGIELSVELSNSHQQEMHILGYFINWEDSSFQQKLKLFREAREKRAYHILDKFKGLGIALDERRLFEIAGVGVVGRPHFAKMLVENKIVSHTREAFWKYLADDKPAYVPKFRLTPDEAIKMILQVGGVPVLAHPNSNSINCDVVKSLVDSGLKGIEVWHMKHSSDETDKFKNIAEKFGMIMTGGSDCHGTMNNEHPTMGTVKVPYSAVISLKNVKGKTLCEQKNSIG
ncbi:MAG: PHP domain-containing protein [Elusimicrobiota bacterium]